MWYIKKYDSKGRPYFLSKDNKWKQKSTGRYKSRVIAWRRSLHCFDTQEEAESYLDRLGLNLQVRVYSRAVTCNGIFEY